MPIKFYWHTAMLILLHIAYSFFHATMTESIHTAACHTADCTDPVIN
jgi:hypothetical protein